MSNIPNCPIKQPIVSIIETQLILSTAYSIALDMTKVLNEGNVIFRTEYPMIDWVVHFMNRLIKE